MRAVSGEGLGESEHPRQGEAPEAEFKLALRAILRACDDAGISPREIDGFASYSNDRNDPSRLAAALGLPELRFSNMQWGGGGGGGAAAVGNAAAAIAAGMAPRAAARSRESTPSRSPTACSRRPRCSPCARRA
jgi:acetyl-CoA acetyltransferase